MTLINGMLFLSLIMIAALTYFILEQLNQAEQEAFRELSKLAHQSCQSQQSDSFNRPDSPFSISATDGQTAPEVFSNRWTGPLDSSGFFRIAGLDPDDTESKQAMTSNQNKDAA